MYQELAGVTAIGTFLHTEAKEHSKTTYGIVAAMLTKTSPSNVFGSRYLTIAVVGTVVLINSVAWGIPLLVGPHTEQSQSNHTEQQRPRKELHHNSVVKVPDPNTKKLIQTTATVPLPKRAPAPIIKRSTMAATSAAPKEPRQSGTPTTLFPRPESPPTKFPAKPADQNNSRFTVEIDRNALTDLANTSPYAPSRRTEPTGQQQAWQHLSNRTDTYVSPLATAQTIARRASQRFKQVRERLANIDRDAYGSRTSAARRTIPALALTAKQATVVANSQSSTKSAYHYVRPTFVQRAIKAELKRVSPVAASTAAKQRSETTEAAKQSRTRNKKRHRVFASRSSTPSRLEQHRKRLRALSANAKQRKRTVKLRKARARRLAVLRKRNKAKSQIAKRRIAKRRKLRKTISRKRARPAKHVRVARAPQRPAMVNGYRKGFHRDLMMSNFFRAAK